METIINHLGLRELSQNKDELLELIDGEIDHAINQGDF
jgi:hypothetical protein